MRQGGMLAGLVLAGLLGTSALAQDKPLIVYVSPNPLGVNDFLKLGKAGTDRVAEALGGESKTFESTDPTTQRQNLEAAAKEATVVVVIGFEFNDMLPEVAAGVLHPRNVTVSIPSTLPQVRLILADATGIDLEGRRVEYRDPENGQGEVSYSRLVIAAGSVNKLLPVPGVVEHAHGFRGVPVAIKVRR